MPLIEPAEFRAPWWLASPHLQTMWGRVVRGRRVVSFEREILSTPDDDEVILDQIPAHEPSAPRCILLHGLEGSSYSVYIQGMAELFARLGGAVTVLNFRHCARDPRKFSRTIPNKRPRMYHSGETEDLRFLVRTLRSREPGRPLVAIGSSLGGNVLLKYLGEEGDSAEIRAAATLSVPYDLGAGSSYLEQSLMGRLYTQTFLRSLRGKAAGLMERFPEAPLDREALARARSMREFDDAGTAPLHGFADAMDYYARASSIGFLDAVGVPTLCISARDDPFLPRDVLAEVTRRASASVNVMVSESGGHVGFVTGPVPWRAVYWAEMAAVAWVWDEWANDGGVPVGAGQVHDGR